MKSKTVNNSWITTVLLLFLVIITAWTSYQLNTVLIPTKSSAQTDPQFCQNSCTGQNRCDFSTTGGPPGDVNYNDPCCITLATTGDPFACPWPQRGYCTDEQCAAIPEGVSRERCGGPRHSWCNMCISNNCPGYGPTAVPTNAPAPTNPQPTPTNAVTYPTSPIYPTSPTYPTPTSAYWDIRQIPIPTTPQYSYPTITIYNSYGYTPTPVQPESLQNQQTISIINSIISVLFGTRNPTPSVVSVTIPTTLPTAAPTINPQAVISSVNLQAGKTLDIFEFIFWRVVFYDTLLEKNINQKYIEFIKLIPQNEKK